MRALGLTRVSTEAQADSGFSLPEQADRIRAYCATRGFELVDILSDDGVSGRMIERPAVRQALTLAQAKLIDVLVLVKVDRLGRQSHVVQTLIHRFGIFKVPVEFVEQGSGDTASGRFAINIHGAVGEYEMEQIRARTMAGRRSKAESGRMPNAFNLLGYRMVRTWEEQADPSRRSGLLEIDESEAPLVRELFSRYLAGASLNALVNWLNASGWRTKRGNEWRVTTLRLLLENPAYKGEARYGWRSVRSYMAKVAPDEEERKRFQVSREAEWITIPCPSLIEAEAWAQAQTRLADAAERYTGRASLVWPLRGCVECATCVGKRGGPRKAVGQRKATNPKVKAYLQRYYVCPDCRGQITAAKWERKALEFLRESTAPGVQEQRARAAALKESGQATAIDTQVERHRAELRELDAAERKLLGMAQHFSFHIVEEEARKLRQRRQAATLALETALALRGKIEDPDRAARRAEEWSAATRLMIAAAEESPEDMQALFRLCVRIKLVKNGRSRLWVTTAPV